MGQCLGGGHPSGPKGSPEGPGCGWELPGPCKWDIEDEQFLMMLKEKCSTTDAEWEERQKTRQLEIEACSKALAVLRSDDAHDLFTKTFNPAFVQKESSAPALLAQIAKKVGNPRLATLASQVKLDAFTRVKKAIDDVGSASPGKG